MRFELRRHWAPAMIGPVGLVLIGLATAGSSGQDPPPGRLASVVEPPPASEQVAKKKEHCALDARSLAAIGSAKGRQVRVYRGDRDFALFTVAEVIEEARMPVVQIGRLGRLRIGPESSPFEGRVVAAVADSTLSDAEAKAGGELVERLDDDGRNTGLLLMAPHGGELEPPTDLQAERVAEKIGGPRVSTWRCKGYHPRGGQAAFSRWHITSTDISEASYPLLGKVAGRKFAYAVSFHGMVDDRILVGGAAPTRLRVEVRDAIRAALPADAKIAVDIALPGDANGGKDPRNIVNRYVEGGGVQIEQSPRARRDHWRAIADAVAKVYASKL